MNTSEVRGKLYDTTFVLGALRRRAAIKALAASPAPESAVLLAEALAPGTHPDAARIAEVLQQLSAESDAAKVRALWEFWAQSPSAAVAAVLARLGWPQSEAADVRVTRHFLGLAQPGAAPEVQAVVAAFARALPVGDDVANDAIYSAWVRAQSSVLEKLIEEQNRQPASTVLEALHALVSGRLERYAALKDDDGMLLVQAFALAPEPFRARLERSVAASPDRRLKEAYRRALLGSDGVDAATRVENLKRVGDEDGLFQATRGLRLAAVLDLCAHWSATRALPNGERERRAVEGLLAAYHNLVPFQVDVGAKLPDGLVDLFAWWRAEKLTDADLRADLHAADPFRKARGLYLGSERGLVDAARITAAARSEHWPERLVARLLEPALESEGRPEHVFWVAACAGDASLLNTAIAGTQADCIRNRDALAKARGRSRALLEILCLLQQYFFGGGITVDETGEASETGIGVDDAPSDACEDAPDDVLDDGIAQSKGRRR